MLDQDSLRHFEAHCTQESPPRCRASCPFAFDCRAFLERMARGEIVEARKLIENHIPLPGLMAVVCDHPCEQACLRRDYGGSLALHGLELACLLATSRNERILPIPPKRVRLAIVGSGLAGLTAMWDLARKVYPVTLFHEGAVTDVVCAHYPLLATETEELPAKRLLEQDIAALRQRNNASFVETNNVDAELLARLVQEFDAVLLDVDAAKALAPEITAVDRETLLWRESIACAGFCGTSPTGQFFRSAASQAGEGRFAAQTLERLATRRSLTAERNRAPRPLHTDLTEVSVLPRVEPQHVYENGLLPLYTLDEAKAEAARCLQCDCRICVRNCAFLRKNKGYPRVYARQIHNNASIVKGLHTANTLINGCSLCGQCTELCPERFSMAELCLAAREELVEQGKMPPSAHEFALEDMEQASGDESFLVMQDPAVDKAHWVFFPGCQLVAARGEQVLALFSWLQKALHESVEPGLALMLSCCGQPAHWAGRKRLFTEHVARLRAAWESLGSPKVLTACASCLAAFQTIGLPAQSVWELLDSFGQDKLAALCESAGQAELPKFPNLFSLHDPCTARHDLVWQKSVRSLLAKVGIAFAEPAHTGATTSCCGYGGLVWCAQPETAKALTAERTAELTSPGLASCIMCRDRFVASGKECWHILDVLLPHLAHTGTEPGPGLGERRVRRMQVRAALAKETPKEPPCIVLADADLIERLEEEHILRSDIEDTVYHVEEHAAWCENRANGHRLGSWRPRKVTFWVEYTPTDGGFRLHDAWCHRMIVPGSGCRDAETVIAEQQCCTDGGRRERT